MSWRRRVGLDRIPSQWSNTRQPMSFTLDADLAALANCRIFFGHQSVGSNILAGLADLQKGSAHPVAILEHRAGTRPPQACLLHATVGRNEQPLTKCEEFRRIIDEDLAGLIDVALLKFCFIDINEHTDVDALFAQYTSAMDDLARRHPGTAFVHVTAPLRHTPGGLGVLARERLGRPNRVKLANMKRNRFNDLMRRARASTGVFDLAAIQSLHADGRRESFRKDGATYQSLVGAYTDDGGHLNAAGRLVAAREMVRCLAGVARERQAAAAGAAGR